MTSGSAVFDQVPSTRKQQDGNGNKVDDGDQFRKEGYQGKGQPWSLEEELIPKGSTRPPSPLPCLFPSDHLLFSH